MRKRIIIPLLVALLLAVSLILVSLPRDPQPQPLPVSSPRVQSEPVRSWKKGVAGPGGLVVPDLVQYLNVVGASWYHNWHYGGRSFGDVIEYVRNVRSIHTSFSAANVANAPAGATWLVGNEPGDQWQDNLDPEDAAEKYGEIIFTILGVDPTAQIYVGGWKDPSLYLLTTYLAQFEEEFRAKWSVDVRSLIVGWHLHAYVHPYSHLGESTKNAVQRVQRQVRNWIAENPNMKLYITEYGNLYRADAYIMREMTNFFEEEEGITRYAFYHFGNRTHHPETALYGEPWPMLTSLGECYAGLPDVPLQATPTPTAGATSTVAATPTRTFVASATPTATSVPTSGAPPTAEPTSTLWPTPDAFHRAIMDACLAANGEPIILNREAALWKAATQICSGCPLSPEVLVEFGGEAYLAQRYLCGYLWVREGEWENVHHMHHLDWKSYPLGPFMALSMEVTAYTDHDAGMRGDGIMASGQKTYLGAAAAGPSWPFGTVFYIPGWGVVTVGDRGSAISDLNVDIYIGDLAAAMEWGRKRLDVVVLHIPGGEDDEELRSAQ